MRILDIPLHFPNYEGLAPLHTKLYAEVLDKTNPSDINITMSLVLLSHGFMGRREIGKSWFDFRDRLVTHLTNTQYPDIEGLMVGFTENYEDIKNNN